MGAMPDDLGAGHCEDFGNSVTPRAGLGSSLTLNKFIKLLE